MPTCCPGSESVPNRSRRCWQRNRWDVGRCCGQREPSLRGRVAVCRLSDGTPVGGSSSDARQVDRRAAVVMTTATTTAACTRARAARAHYTLQQGPRSTKRAPSTAIEFQRARLRVGKTAFTSTTMWRMFVARTGGPRALARSRRRARAACDLEGNRAGLGCLEAPPKCIVVRSGHGVACRSVTTSPLSVTTSCLSSTGGWPIQPVRVYVGLK